MKPLFLAAALIAATCASAQKFEIGLNGGIGFNSAPSVNPAVFYGPRPSDVSLAACLKALYVRNNWQYGIGVDYAELSFKANYYSPVFLPQYLAWYAPPAKATFEIGKPAIPFKLFVNRQKVINHLKTYAGISAGYVLLTNSQGPYDYERKSKYSGNGWTVGLEIGGTYIISKRFGINGEAAANYMSLDVKPTHYSLWQFPFTLGVRYKL